MDGWSTVFFWWGGEHVFFFLKPIFAPTSSQDDPITDLVKQLRILEKGFLMLFPFT